MTVVLFDVDALEHWKLRLRNLANAGDLCQEQVLSCLESLEQLGHTIERQPALPIRNSSPEYDLAVMAPTHKTCVSIGTQLWTVRPIHYTHHLLNRVRRERQVKRLTRRLGEVAADLHCVGYDLWRLLQASGVLQTLTPLQRLPDETIVEPLDKGESLGIAVRSTNGALPALSPSTLHTLRSLFGRFSTFDTDLALHWTNLKAPSAATMATSKPPIHVKTQGDKSVQTSLAFTAECATVHTPRERLPFLCRRCRQDGRASYHVDKARMQLTQTHDIVSDGGGAEQQALLKRAPLRCAVTRGVDPPLARSSGARRSICRTLPTL
nr:unnamed protein product [Leishmania braziliensis]